MRDEEAGRFFATGVAESSAHAPGDPPTAGAADTIKPRMRAAGAELSRVFVPDAVRDLGEEGKAIARRAFGG